MLEFAGLPLHPLLVHTVVVLLPLSALAFIVLAFVAKWRRPFDVVVLAGLVIGTVFAFGAKLSGESLADVVGNPVEHANWGNILPWVAIALCVVVGAWLWATRRQRSSLVVTVTSVVGVILAVAVIVLTVLVGHSGAEAVWKGRIPDASTSTSTPTPSAISSSAAASDQLTLAQVKTHNSQDDCWAVVAGNVYDLTDWISQHPGGEQTILDMCGTDATDAFNAQHGGEGQPEAELANFLLGPLAG